MSYILDALRRAEAERARGAVPGLHAQPLAGVPAAAQPSRWPWIAVVLGVAGLLFGAWAWWRMPTTAPPAAVVQAPPSPAAAPAPLAPPASPAPPAPPAPQPAPPAAVPPPDVQPPKASPAAAPRPAAAARPVVAARPAPAASDADAPAAPPRIPRLAELPESLRSALPPITIGGAIGSPKPAARLLIVNGQLLHEGDEAAPGLHIREIRLRSAVLEFRGQRYEQPF